MHKVLSSNCNKRHSYTSADQWGRGYLVRPSNARENGHCRTKYSCKTRSGQKNIISNYHGCDPLPAANKWAQQNVGCTEMPDKGQLLSAASKPFPVSIEPWSANSDGNSALESPFEACLSKLGHIRSVRQANKTGIHPVMSEFSHRICVHLCSF